MNNIQYRYFAYQSIGIESVLAVFYLKSISIGLVAKSGIKVSLITAAAYLEFSHIHTVCTYVSMYIRMCMYVRIYVHMYACMYVCTHVYMYIRMYNLL